MAYLPLHQGRAPKWLIDRMKKLASSIAYIIVSEYGTEEFLNRISNPFWFQSLGCVLGYDWHSSGVTTVLTGVLKTVLKPNEHGIAVAGGKGKTSMKTLDELSVIGERFNLSTFKIKSLIRASRLSAKVDNNAIQDGYHLYHHSMFVDEKGNWVVVQQGMNTLDKTARRYHWNSSKTHSFVEEPHEAIVSDKIREKVLDLTAKESRRCREISVDLVKENPLKVKRMIESIAPKHQSRLSKWMTEKPSEKEYYCSVLYMPRRINWKILREVYETQPRNYEELLEIRGVGRSTIRGLALVSEIIYGEPPSWKDPTRFSFAFGGKDGVPFPVNRDEMDEVYKILSEAIEKAKLGSRDKLRALERLKNLLSR